MQFENSPSTHEDFLVSSIIGLIYCNIFMGGMMFLHWYGWIVL